jgi:type IV secretion system protein VirB5
MASHHKSTIYPPLPVSNPFQRQDAVYADLLANAEISKKKWRMTAFISQLLNIAAIGLLLYAVSLRKYIPVIVTVSPWGEAQYAGDASGLSYQNARIPDIAIQYQIRDFLVKLRSISSDSDVLYNNITDCYTKVTTACAAKMTAELRSADPFSEVGRIKRSLTVETILRLSEHTWQVDWVETSASSTTTARRYRGVFTIALLEPPAKQRMQNPLGIYIDTYDITEIQGFSNAAP